MDIYATCTSILWHGLYCYHVCFYHLHSLLGVLICCWHLLVMWPFMLLLLNHQHSQAFASTFLKGQHAKKLSSFGKCILCSKILVRICKILRCCSQAGARCERPGPNPAWLSNLCSRIGLGFGSMGWQQGLFGVVSTKVVSAVIWL